MRSTAISFTLEPFALIAVLALAHPGQVRGVQADEHGAADSAGWRVPPMEPATPMLPGLIGAVPPVGAFMPGRGVDLSGLPKAMPSSVVEMADGDTLDLSVSLVHRELLGRSYIMYGYNGQYPGPLIRANRGSTVVVRVTNEVELSTSVHWHGVRLDNRFDGVPGLTQAPIERNKRHQPGGNRITVTRKYGKNQPELVDTWRQPGICHLYPGNGVQ